MDVSPPSGSARSHPKGLVSITEGWRNPRGGGSIYTSIPFPGNLGAATFPPPAIIAPVVFLPCVGTYWDFIDTEVNIDGEEQRKPCPHSHPPPHGGVNTACKLWAPVSSSAILPLRA